MSILTNNIFSIFLNEQAAPMGPDWNGTTSFLQTVSSSGAFQI